MNLSTERAYCPWRPCCRPSWKILVRHVRVIFHAVSMSRLPAVRAAIICHVTLWGHMTIILLGGWLMTPVGTRQHVSEISFLEMPQYSLSHQHKVQGAGCCVTASLVPTNRSTT
ncbi:hypothetical protein BJX64DRAFT_115773 [Aspergillus heterothallicus]